MILATMEDNRLLETLKEADGYKLTAVKNSDELMVMYPYIEFTGVTEEDLKEVKLTSHIQTSSTTEYISLRSARKFYSPKTLIFLPKFSIILMSMRMKLEDLLMQFFSNRFSSVKFIKWSKTVHAANLLSSRNLMRFPSHLRDMTM